MEDNNDDEKMVHARSFIRRRGELNIKEEYIFWRLAYSFITVHGYRIIQLFENEKELWLEKLENKKVPVIRILLHDFDWSNALQRDIEFVAGNGERVRRQTNRSQLHVLNIYVSSLLPVDEYKFRLTRSYFHPEGNKTSVSSILFVKGEYNQSFEQLSKFLGKDEFFSVEKDFTQEEIERLKSSAIEHAVKRVKAEKAIFQNGKPFMTYLFMIIQVAVFFWLELHGGSTNISTLVKYGAKVNVLINQGQWWRLVTPIFLHIGYSHLIMNTISLYFLGITVERMYGSFRFFVIYLFAGVLGFIASFLFSPSISAGASGAIFGCFGALLFFGVMYPKLFFRTMGMSVIFILGLNLVMDFSTTGFDNAGHIGGLIGGFLAAGIVYFPKKKKPWLQLLLLVLTMALVWTSLSYGGHTAGSTMDEESTISLAQQYMDQNEYDKAYSLLENFKKESKPSENTYLMLGFVEVKKQLFQQAKIDLNKAIELNPNMSQAYYYLAIININENNVQQAKKNAEMAVKIKPDDQDYKNLLAKINQYFQ